MSVRPLTATDLERSIMESRYRRSFVLPHYTPGNGRSHGCRWWECDVFEVTDAGYFREYEVKMTLADFKADQKKERFVHWNYWSTGNRETQTKHQLLASGSTDGPSRFWFVTPESLIERSLVPPWAGLIEMRRMYENSNRCLERVVVDAPALHRERIQQQVIDHARSVIYYRMHQLFQDNVLPMIQDLDEP